MKIAFLFAGQGAQAVGMGADFYSNLDSVKDLYDSFPEVKKLCFLGPKELLDQTQYAQPAMLLTSYAIASALKDEGIEPEYACGLSLGEYSALAFANTWNIKDAIDIISFRGNLMQNALPLGTSGMAAVIGLDRDVILDTIKDIPGVLEIANYNCPGQIVITGDIEAINASIEPLKARGARRVLPLNVSGAFHSSLLKDASHKLKAKLDEYTPNKPMYNIIYNITGKEENALLNEILEKQICNSVFFEDSIRYLIDKGVDTFIEIGPGASLTSFVKKVNKDLCAMSVSSYEDFLKVKEVIKNA